MRSRVVIFSRPAFASLRTSTGRQQECVQRIQLMNARCLPADILVCYYFEPDKAVTPIFVRPLLIDVTGSLPPVHPPFPAGNVSTWDQPTWRHHRWASALGGPVAGSSARKSGGSEADLRIKDGLPLSPHFANPVATFSSSTSENPQKHTGPWSAFPSLSADGAGAVCPTRMPWPPASLASSSRPAVPLGERPMIRVAATGGS